uniref:Small ribosomal subunit protein uS11c n=1 Tax=Prototheca stagnorum TaxID=215448 RepID=A0A2Z6BEM0_9CHLO|nr:ribosomal protein s11 [Prototheca stagnorum]BBD20173.1 ribosomal protein s11 [Prototheca stagnorum]
MSSLKSKNNNNNTSGISNFSFLTKPTSSYKNKKKKMKKQRNKFLNSKAFYKAFIYIKTNESNSFFSVCDFKGNILTISTCGRLQDQSVKKKNNMALYNASEKIIYFIKENKIKYLFIAFDGFGLARKAFLNNLQKINTNIIEIRDYASVPHNGCRLKKQKRL